MTRWPAVGLLGLLGLAVWAEAAGAPDARWAASTGAGVEAFEDGRYAEAERMFRMALEQAGEFRAPDARLVESLVNLARTYLALHRYAEAEPLLRRAVSTQEALAGPRHPSVAALLADLALVLRTLGRGTEAASVEAHVRSILAEPTLQEPHSAWVKRGAGREEFERDEADCLGQARYGGSQYGPLIDPKIYARCLEQHGWRKTMARGEGQGKAP